jgi:hypothetical protein
MSSSRRGGCELTRGGDASSPAMGAGGMGGVERGGEA